MRMIKALNVGLNVDSERSGNKVRFHGVHQLIKSMRKNFEQNEFAYTNF